MLAYQDMDAAKMLAEEVRRLKDTGVGRLVRSRIRGFKETGRSGQAVFRELCFCILTAGFNAERSIRIQEAVGEGFLTLPEDRLAEELRRLGHRYPRVRARYIVEARRYSGRLREVLSMFGSGREAREWLVRNVRGLGYKEASHFLRNVGFEDVAIIDFHILDLLARRGVVDKPKTLTRRRYLEVESILERIASTAGVSLAELDLYLWYMETGKVLK